MIFIIAALILLFPCNVHGADVTQKTAGWCSPAIADVKGHVTITCNGVDPRALRRFNELLDKKDEELKGAKLTIQAKIKEAEEWANKYRDLEARLSMAGEDNKLAHQAKELLQEGKFDEAGALLDKLLDSGEKEIDRIASYHFNRAEIFALQFKPQFALAHYEKAYQYRTENYKYAFGYGRLLIKQNYYSNAEPVLLVALKQALKLARTNPIAYVPDVAAILNDLAILYQGTQRYDEAEKAYQEAMEAYRKLARTNPAAYEPYVARTLHNLW